ncbi:hypothetical protein [Streptosporangium sp. NPDC002524]
MTVMVPGAVAAAAMAAIMGLHPAPIVARSPRWAARRRRTS